MKRSLLKFLSKISLKNSVGTLQYASMRRFHQPKTPKSLMDVKMAMEEEKQNKKANI